jgi:hypothetical protein
MVIIPNTKPLKLAKHILIVFALRLARERPPITKQQAQPDSTSPLGVDPQPPLEPLEVVKFVCKE